MIRWIADILRDRQIHIETVDGNSSNQILTHEVPQGSESDFVECYVTGIPSKLPATLHITVRRWRLLMGIRNGSVPQQLQFGIDVVDGILRARGKYLASETSVYLQYTSTCKQFRKFSLSLIGMTTQRVTRFWVWADWRVFVPEKIFRRGWGKNKQGCSCCSLELEVGLVDSALMAL